ncbi:hypothetical protein D3C80_651520 [compost metagenome]|jgi:hypothetical protein
MKFQYLEMEVADRTNTHLHDEIEVNSFEEAIRKTMFRDDYVAEQYEIDNIVADFVEKDNMFICDGEELVCIFFKR